MNIQIAAVYLGLVLSGIALLAQIISIGIYLGKLDGFKNLVNFRFEALEKKQDKHNGIIERTYCNERDISVLKEQIKVENHRIQDLEDIIK